jgi:acetolactate synthase-1/3 small subunit
VTPNTFTVQLVGSSSKLDAFIEALGTSNIMEVVRSGVSGIARGEKILAL